jgi:hypothetical protein
MLARLKAGMEAARPGPLLGGDRNIGSETDAPNDHVAIGDAPDFSMRAVGAAAESWDECGREPFRSPGKKINRVAAVAIGNQRNPNEDVPNSRHA